MYAIKQIPEDFIVKEHLQLKQGLGAFAYYLLKKRNYTTAKAIQMIARELNINEKYINYAGNKDRRAVTEQYISINRGPQKNVEGNEISLTYISNGSERINLGSLDENEFTITVRNLTEEDITTCHKNRKILKIPNYFDEQRFGTNKNNHIIGKHIIKKEFKEACSLVEETNEYLQNHPNDYVGALKSINRRILRLYVHAYQSYLWNTTIERLLKTNIKVDQVPLIGFDCNCKDEKVQQIIDSILQEEKIDARDFIIREIPEISSEGGSRTLFTEVNDFKLIKKAKDELNENKQKIILNFKLQKGCYATNVIKYLFNDDRG